MKKQNKKGFTLVELLVVIAILSILATVSVVGYSQFTEKAKKSNDETELHQIALIVESQLIDGEETVTLDSTHVINFKYDSTTGLTATCSDSTHSSALGENELKEAVIKLCGDDNKNLLTASGTEFNAEITTDKKLKLTYKHNAKEASTWTFGA